MRALLSVLLIASVVSAGCIVESTSAEGEFAPAPAASGVSEPTPDPEESAPGNASLSDDEEVAPDNTSVSEDNEPAPDAAPTMVPGPAAVDTPPVVIALVDLGANPYHVAFQGGPSFADVPGFPSDARALDLTLDAETYEAAVEADAHLWEEVGEGNLVWFPGTRLASISVSRLAGSPYAVLDDHGHGTVTTHAAIEASPHAVVVLVQVSDDEFVAEALHWVAAQPWIDVVSVSAGLNPPEIAEGEVLLGIADAYREVVRAGKIAFNAAGNFPWAHTVDENSAPPFIVAVGGARQEARGDAWFASRFPDVVSEFVHPERAAAGTLAEYRSAAGTSLACPQVAGSVAEALWLVRDGVGATSGGVTPAGALLEAKGGGALSDGRLTAEELREAMNRAAAHWGPAEWGAPEAGSNPSWVIFAGAPVAAPAAQMGWGYVGPNQTSAIAGDLLGTAPLPEKPAEVQAFMQARQAARAAIWGEA